MSGTSRPFPRIEARPLAAAGTLAGDALAGGEAAGLFAAPPGTLPNPAPGRGRRVDAPARSAFTTVSDGADERLERILSGDGAFVTAGQQPGLFLGPLYTLYKALTAVRTAKRLERESGRPALALFWVASDDHDWDEVAACRVLGPEEELVALRLEAPVGHAGRSVGTAPLPDEVEELLRRFRALAGGAVSGTAPPWLEVLRRAYEPGRSFGAAFVEALRAATDGLNLAILDSGRPELRSAAAKVYREILAEPARVIDAMAAGRTAVEKAGYEPLLTPPSDGLQVFFDDDGARRHLLRADGGFSVDRDLRWSADELRRRLEEDPGAFTPAAALRPVVESRLLPVAASVLGPGEMGYWAQLRPLFIALDAPMPHVVPRDAWVLVEPRVDRLLQKLDLDVATVEAEGRAIEDRWIDGARPPAVREALDGLDAALDDAFDEVDGAMDDELPGLKSAAGKARHRSQEALEELGRTVDARVREREAVALRQAERLRAHLTPGGQPQERMLAAAQFLARHGRPLVRDLIGAAEERGRVAGPENSA